MTEHGPERVHAEPLVLDLGGDVGALIIYTDPEWRSREIELSPAGREAARFHNQVHERLAGGASVFAAVYPNVRAGEYDIWRDGSTKGGRVIVTGGQIVTVDWRSSAR